LAPVALVNDDLTQSLPAPLRYSNEYAGASKSDVPNRSSRQVERVRLGNYANRNATNQPGR
jgi:hypothetical protein